MNIINRLQKYSLGSQSLAVLSGVLGQTAICTAVTVNLNLDGPFVGDTFIAGGGGSGGLVIYYNIDLSLDIDDVIKFDGSAASGGIVFLQGRNGSLIFSSDVLTVRSPHLYSLSDTVNGSLDVGSSYGYLYRGDSGGNLGVWSADQIGAVGFKTGDNQFGFLNVSWDVSEKTLTILGGKLETTPNVGIVVTAVPEPSEYAAALGLGALGLAYYRRRPGNKIRPKNN